MLPCPQPEFEQISPLGLLIGSAVLTSPPFLLEFGATDFVPVHGTWLQVVKSCLLRKSVRPLVNYLGRADSLIIKAAKKRSV